MPAPSPGSLAYRDSPVLSNSRDVVPVPTWGNTCAWKRGRPALVGSTRARCPGSQEKCEHRRDVPHRRWVRSDALNCGSTGSNFMPAYWSAASDALSPTARNIALSRRMRHLQAGSSCAVDIRPATTHPLRARAGWQARAYDRRAHPREVPIDYAER